MTVYFDHHVQFPGSSTSLRNARHHLMSWHTTYSILAVASKNEDHGRDGSVNFFLDEGDVIEDASIFRSTVVQCMEWHPENKVIAIGWQSGEITTYHHSEEKVHEQSSIHRSSIAVVRWNQSGSRLISGDESGLLVVWKVEALGKLHPIPLHQHRLHSAITHCLMFHPGSGVPTAPALSEISVASGSSKGKKGSKGNGSARGSVVGKRGSGYLEGFNWPLQSVPNSISCFCITAGGVLYFLNNSGECCERSRVEGTTHSLLLSPGADVLSAITKEMLISQFTVCYDGQTILSTANAKLSSRNKVESIISLSHKHLASCSNESQIRFWDFENNENYVLDVQNYSRFEVEEVVTCISYNPTNGVLVAGTNTGSIFLWKWRDSLEAMERRDGSQNWEFISSSSIPEPTISLAWGSKRNLLSVNSGRNVVIFSEHLMNSHFNQQVSVVQLSPGEVLVECHETKLCLTIKTDMHISGIYATKEHVTLWSGRKLEVYYIARDKAAIRPAGSFSTNATVVSVYEASIFTLEKRQISIRTFQGTVKQVLTCMEVEGCPSTLSIDTHFLVSGTDAGRLKLWDISRREAKLLGSTNLRSCVPELGAILSVHSSSNGSKISIIAEQGEDGAPCLLVWFVDADTVKAFSSSAITTPTDDDEDGPSPTSPFSPFSLPLDLPTNSLTQQQDQAKELHNRVPISHHWDPEEPQVLAVEWVWWGEELELEKSGLKISRSTSFGKFEMLVSIFFITPERSLLISELVPTQTILNNLMGIKSPFLYYSKKGSVAISPQDSAEQQQKDPQSRPPETAAAAAGSIAIVTLRDFVGLEGSEPEVIHAMTSFSYHVAVGNLDEAFKAIQSIKSRAVWESMAKVCVKTERLDVAIMCLGNMGNARAARAVRESKKVPQLEVRLAVLAVELGMLEEAEKLYKKSKRFDLLNQFYQLSGQWSKAMEVAETKDRVHLKTTYYNYARHAEEMGEINAAINSYEKSNTHRFEVPRMLLDDPAQLESYVLKSKDREVRKWWAEYLESCGEWEQAMQFYETANDYYSLVRILCFNGQTSRAAEIVEESGCRAAAYHLARRLSVENEDPRKAIHFFTKAQCYSPAIQIAKENGLDHELMNLALLSSQEDMLDAARYYEDNSSTIDKAILLFHKAGEVSHALDLCFQHHHYEVLDQIAEDLHEGSSPEMTQRVADYFMEKGLFDKAMELLVRTKQMEEALKLCTLHSVPLTEELVEKISVPKMDNESAEEAEHRVKVLEQLADCCLSLGSYHLAAKKYTQAGNKTKAMKALLKSGDTEKIVFFAGVSRQKDIYVMAANYLQTLDWRNDPSIMKNIISFYTKGRALDSLAGFYDACAQVEIDEFQDYRKAAGALDEAIKVLGKVKAKNPAALEAKITFFKERVELVKKFADAKESYQENAQEAMQACQSLLDEPRLDTAVRAGDVFGFMIENYSESGNFEQAYALMKEMRQRIPNVNLTYYMDIRVIENVHAAMGVPLGRGVGREDGTEREAGHEEEEEHEEEEVESDVDEY